MVSYRILGVISEYYNQIDPTDKALLEYTLRGFCRYLGIRTSKINLMVKASYLMDIDKLYLSSHQEAFPCIFPKGLPSSPEFAKELNGQKHHSAKKDAAEKTEVEISTYIAQEMLRFSNIAEILQNVKERWDGLGYPDELRGSKIPMESRILAIVGAYVSVLHKKNSEEDALMQVKKEAGKKFDPNLVSKFEQFLKEQRKKKQTEVENKTADPKAEVRSAVVQI